MISYYNNSTVSSDSVLGWLVGWLVVCFVLWKVFLEVNLMTN